MFTYFCTYAVKQARMLEIGRVQKSREKRN